MCPNPPTQLVRMSSSHLTSAGSLLISLYIIISGRELLVFHPSNGSKGSLNFATPNSSNKKTPTCPNLGRTNQANDEVKVCMCLRLRTADTLLFTSLKYLESCSNAIIYSMNHSVIHEEYVMAGTSLKVDPGYSNYYLQITNRQIPSKYNKIF